MELVETAAGVKVRWRMADWRRSLWDRVGLLGMASGIAREIAKEIRRPR